MKDSVIWKHAKGMPEYIEVSDLGQVRRRLDNNEYKLLPFTKINKKHYVSIDGLQCPVDRMICDTFLSDALDKTFVIHLDGDRLNDELSNLTWASRSEMNKKRASSQLHRVKPILCIETNVVYDSAIAAVWFTGIPREVLLDAIYSKSSCFGVHYRYVTPDDNLAEFTHKYISASEIVTLSHTLSEIPKEK